MRDWHFMEWGWIVVAIAVASGLSSVKRILNRILEEISRERFAASAHRSNLEEKFDELNLAISHIQPTADETVGLIQSMKLEIGSIASSGDIKTLGAILGELALSASEIQANSHQANDHLLSLVMNLTPINQADI